MQLPDQVELHGEVKLPDHEEERMRYGEAESPLWCVSCPEEEARSPLWCVSHPEEEEEARSAKEEDEEEEEARRAEEEEADTNNKGIFLLRTRGNFCLSTYHRSPLLVHKRNRRSTTTPLLVERC